MNSADYVPQGPSDSIYVRNIAEKKYSELISSPIINERSKFIEWCSKITNELLGLETKKEEIKVNNDFAEQNAYEIKDSYIFDKFTITEELKLPSSSSLSKIKHNRNIMNQYLKEFVLNGETISKTSNTEPNVNKNFSDYKKSTKENVKINIDNEHNHTEYGGVLDSISSDKENLRKIKENNNNSLSFQQEEAVGSSRTRYMPSLSDDEPRISDLTNTKVSSVRIKDIHKESLGIRLSSDGLDLSGGWKASSGVDESSSKNKNASKRSPLNSSLDLSNLTKERERSIFSKITPFS